MTDPWDWYIYLHELLVVVGKYKYKLHIPFVLWIRHGDGTVQKTMGKKNFQESTCLGFMFDEGVAQCNALFWIPGTLTNCVVSLFDLLYSCFFNLSTSSLQLVKAAFFSEMVEESIFRLNLCVYCIFHLEVCSQHPQEEAAGEASLSSTISERVAWTRVTIRDGYQGYLHDNLAGKMDACWKNWYLYIYIYSFL